jgi:beta-phosphoglucomutase-like phosphatase (HAD superfamily)
VASSSSAAQIRHRLHQVDVMRHFEALAGGDEVPRGKPDPAVYQLAASRLGVRACDCVAFEDSDNGARSALASGAQVVLVPDLGLPSRSVIERSLHRLGTLHEAIEHVPRWFSPAGSSA